MNLRMKELRLKAGFRSQDDLAAQIGETKRKVGAWERQETQITLADAMRLCDALGCTPNDLCGWYEDHPRESGTTRDESLMLADYRACTPDRRRMISTMARDMAGASQECVDSSPPSEAASA